MLLVLRRLRGAPDVCVAEALLDRRGEWEREVPLGAGVDTVTGDEDESRSIMTACRRLTPAVISGAWMGCAGGTVWGVGDIGAEFVVNVKGVEAGDGIGVVRAPVGRGCRSEACFESGAISRDLERCGGLGG